MSEYLTATEAKITAGGGVQVKLSNGAYLDGIIDYSIPPMGPTSLGKVTLTLALIEKQAR